MGLLASTFRASSDQLTRYWIKQTSKINVPTNAVKPSIKLLALNRKTNMQ